MKTMKPKVESFPPIVDASATILILGSMPGVESLRAQQYYAHPRNAFWKIMRRVLGFPESATYVERTEALKRNGIALWDVMQSCERSGSLDSNIDRQSIEPNDFVSLFREYRRIRCILFNGLAAETAYRKHVLPRLTDAARDISMLRLPSTSPAMARLSFEEKLDIWSRAIKDAAEWSGSPR